MPYGVCASALGMISTTARSTSSGPARRPTAASARSRARRGCAGVRSPAVAITLRNAAGDANTSVAPIASAASAKRDGAECAGRGHAHIGHDRRHTHRRAVEGEGGERGDEPIVGTDAVGPGEHIALRLQLMMPVHHAFGRARRARSEDDRGGFGVRRCGRKRLPFAEPRIASSDVVTPSALATASGNGAAPRCARPAIPNARAP